LKLAPLYAIVFSGFALGACKYKSGDSSADFRADADARRGSVRTDRQGMGFEPDEALAKTAATASQDAVKLAKQNFNVVLDWSDSSIGDLERVLDGYYRLKLDAGTDEQALSQVGALFGSYMGEVFRRNHGGTWGFVTQDASRFPGMRAEHSGQLFWPWGRVQNRIVNGPSDNVVGYYRIIVRDDVFK
jgi:hypothetical protein